MSVTQGTWNTTDQIHTHRLATSIINHHDTPDEVFDADCLAELRAFVLHRSVATRDAWLAERGFDTGDDNAAKKESLTGYIIARYGTGDEAFDERDWELLEEWFGKGMPVGESVTR